MNPWKNKIFHNYKTPAKGHAFERKYRFGQIFNNFFNRTATFKNKKNNTIWFFKIPFSILESTLRQHSPLRSPKQPSAWPEDPKHLLRHGDTNKGGGIRGGNKENRQQSNGSQRGHLSQRQLTEQSKKGIRNIFLQSRSQFGNALHIKVNGIAAHNRHKYAAKDHGNQHRTDHKLPNSAALGDPGNKAADKGPPGKPPGPVKDRPGTEPTVAFSKGIGPETFGNQTGDIFSLRNW